MRTLFGGCYDGWGMTRKHQMTTTGSLLLFSYNETRAWARTWVSLELRKGMCLAEACSAQMTSPSALSDLLMLWASFSACPATSLRPILSEPAESQHPAHGLLQEGL